MWVCCVPVFCHWANHKNCASTLQWKIVPCYRLLCKAPRYGFYWSWIHCVKKWWTIYWLGACFNCELLVHCDFISANFVLCIAIKIGFTNSISQIWIVATTSTKSNNIFYTIDRFLKMPYYMRLRANTEMEVKL